MLFQGRKAEYIMTKSLTQKRQHDDMVNQWTNDDDVDIVFYVVLQKEDINLRGNALDA